MVAAEIISLFVFAGFSLPMAWVFWNLRPLKGAGRRWATLLWIIWSCAALLVAAYLAAAFSTSAVMTALGWLVVSSAGGYVVMRLSPEPPPQEKGPEPEPTDEWLQVEPGEAVLSSLAAEGIDGELILTMPSDITSGGAFGERMFVATAEHVAALSISDGNGKVTVDFKAPLADITGAKSEALVGGGSFEVSIRGEPMVLLRYTNAHVRDYAQVAKKFSDYIKDRDAKPEPEEPAEAGEAGEEPDERPCEPDALKPEKKPAKLSFFDVDRGADRKCPGCGRGLPEGTAVCPVCLKKSKVIRRLMGLSWPHRWKIAVLGTLMLIGTVAAVLPPYLVKVMVDDVLGAGRNAALLLPLVLGLVAVRVLNVIVGTIRGWLSVSVGAKITLDVRSRCFHHLQRLSLGYFDKQKVGGLMSRLDRDTRQLQGILTDVAQFTVINGLTLVGICTVMLWMNWKLAIVVFLPAPFVVAGWTFFMHRLHRLWGRMWQRFQRFSAFLNDSLSGVRVVKAFGQEQREIKRFDREAHTLMEAVVQAQGSWHLIAPSMGFLMSSGGLLVWYFGGRQVLAGSADMTLGKLMAFLSYLGMFYGPLSMITRINEWLANSLTAAERVFEVLDTKPDVADVSDSTAMPKIEGEVELRDVSFSYDKIKPVLKDVSLTVEPGEMIGLVGHSGAGKSTTINLICRLYDVDDGAILVDGVDVRNVRLEDLRSQIGVVLQETFLFSGSIAENIAYARPGVSREEIMQAALAANAHDFIMKRPDGYETQVGEGGKGLSGGEKQRISIARAILHNPRILILDEATSAVDTETERQIQEALSRLVLGRTTFAIAHRLSTLRNADRLLVLDGGKLAELGTHEELMEKDGVYAKLVEMQTEMNRIMAVKG